MRVSGVNFNLNQINAIENLTGHIPSILGCDYANGQDQAIPPQKLIKICQMSIRVSKSFFCYFRI